MLKISCQQLIDKLTITMFNCLIRKFPIINSPTRDYILCDKMGRKQFIMMDKSQ